MNILFTVAAYAKKSKIQIKLQCWACEPGILISRFKTVRGMRLVPGQASVYDYIFWLPGLQSKGNEVDLIRPR